MKLNCLVKDCKNNRLEHQPNPGELTLSSNIQEISQKFFPLHRCLEQQYRGLPWPDKIKKVVVFTAVCGGKGDISAAAKAIDLMLGLNPGISIDWVLRDDHFGEYDVRLFLSCDNSSNVSIRKWKSKPTDTSAVDFLLAGPVFLDADQVYLKEGISREVVGPIFGFVENARSTRSFSAAALKQAVDRLSVEISTDKVYQTIHPILFPNQSSGENSSGLLPMGLQTGTGVFLDQSFRGTPLSRGYCCPSYLLQIEDADLRKDILNAMGVFETLCEPDYDQYSFNFGYAHRVASWGKFIDCTAIHEKNKHVVIVLNQHGAFTYTEKFEDQVFTPERLLFLENKGYGTVVFKTKEGESRVLQQKETPLSRCLTLIVRSSFHPKDMRRLQLASERLLATGDNSAVEAWGARCKLYVYEDVDNMNSKWLFLQQQVDLAQSISESLSQLLALFGGDRRLKDPCINKPLTKEKMDQLEQLLNDPDLSNATLKFCDLICARYSFSEVFENALKRTLWHQCSPEFSMTETEVLGQEFRSDLVEYLRSPTEKKLKVPDVSSLACRVGEIAARILAVEDI